MVELVKKRSQAIDMVKGLSIMTLFFLHFENGCFDFKYNYFLVRSPAFYMVVGWLWGMSSHKRTVKEHWGKRKQGLVKPYLWFSLIFLMFDLLMVLLHLFEPFILWRDVYKTVVLRGIGTLWFLPALLGGEMLFLVTRDRSWLMKSICYVVGFAIMCLYAWWRQEVSYTNSVYKDLINAPFRVILDVSTAFLYLSISYYVSLNFGKKQFSAPSQRLFVEGALLLLLAFFVLNFTRIADFLIWNEFMFVVGNVCAGLGILLFFKSIEHIAVIEKPLAYCGRNSLSIMAVHFCLLLPVAQLVNSDILHKADYSGCITVVYFFVAVVLQIGITELINSKFKFIIGK